MGSISPLESILSSPEPGAGDRSAGTAPVRAATLDPLAAWRALPPDIQERLGATAVALGVAALGVCVALEHGDPAAHNRCVATRSEALSLLYGSVTIHVLSGDDVAMPPFAELRPLGIRQCVSCGCTEDFGCDGGCEWVDFTGLALFLGAEAGLPVNDLCSRCCPATPPAPASATLPEAVP